MNIFGFIVLMSVVIWLVYMRGYVMGYQSAKWKYEQPELCSHGYEWDDCPDCCH